MTRETTPPVGESRQALNKQITVRVKLKYLLFLPPGYHDDPRRTWPTILFLHGAGERGDDLEQVKVHGPMKVAPRRDEFPFIVLAPQCPADQWWQPLEVIALLDEAASTLRVDPDRVYLTGLSMGGFGTWAAAISYPDRFAAIAPICGGGSPYMAWRIKDVPAWAFHGARDELVPPAKSEEMVTALKQCGGDVRLTVYPEAGHDAWTQTYDSPELYDWFLAHRRPPRPTPAAETPRPASP